MTTTHDTAATLEAAIDDYGNATAREAMNADERAALHSAITAHVEAEVARRLAAAPEVEKAIETHGDACYERGFRHAHKSEAVDSELDAAYDRLRAAIAADKARAVDEANSFAAAICKRVGAHETGTGGQQVTTGPLCADAAKRIDRMIARDKARLTPDEARRLVEALETAAFEWGMRRNNYERDATATARAALLRALGVEA